MTRMRLRLLLLLGRRVQMRMESGRHGRTHRVIRRRRVQVARACGGDVDRIGLLVREVAQRDNWRRRSGSRWSRNGRSGSSGRGRDVEVDGIGVRADNCVGIVLLLLADQGLGRGRLDWSLRRLGRGRHLDEVLLLQIRVGRARDLPVEGLLVLGLGHVVITGIKVFLALLLE